MKSTRILAFALAGLGLHAGAQAQTAPDKWEVELTPYLWAAGMDGTMAVGPKEASVSVGFQDLLKSLDFGFMGRFEARNDRWSLASDLVYTNLGKDAQLTDAGADVGAVVLDTKMLVVEGTAGYRLGRSPVEAVAGARIYSVKADVQADRVGELASGSGGWVDPIVGLRLRKWVGGDKWLVALRGDVGGFGVGSDFAWALSAGLGYRLNRSLTLSAGYRAWNFDREGEREISKLDMTMGGFGLGMAIRF
jgi:hypothetical protein